MYTNSFCFGHNYPLQPIIPASIALSYYVIDGLVPWKVRDIAQKHKHRANLEVVYPQSYWNKNRAKAAEEGDVDGEPEPTRLFVDVKSGRQ